MKPEIAVYWFRRDLRIDDNTAFYHALISGLPVLPIFIFDKIILDKLDDKEDKRIVFIYDQLNYLSGLLAKNKSSLLVKYGTPIEVWKEIVSEFNVKSVFVNHDYEPYAIARDAEIEKFLTLYGISFNTYKDQVIFEKEEIVKEDGNPYTIYTPYSKKWMLKLADDFLKSFPAERHLNNLYKINSFPIPSLEVMEFIRNEGNFPDPRIDDQLIAQYDSTRNFPALKGTSRLSVHLRFGTISIRKLVNHSKKNHAFLNELCWREFYQMILWHFPRVVNQSFKTIYDNIKWRNNENEFEAWCKGETGYPIVDAGMHELNETGFMHNRVRMITASFLTKHLLIDWRWGEAWFAKKLLDFELASNNGGWQWAAGTGCDAAPYFRIFNPSAQTKKFDPSFIYIKKWVTNLEEPSYPPPIVDHKFARERCLMVYKDALKK